MFAELLRSKLAGICELSPEQIERLRLHYELLSKWNQTVNLTAVRNLEDAVERHYCESVFLAFHLPVGPISVADVGSGAGFPGIPIAILRPECSVALIESHQRKAVFLREASRDLSNVCTLPKRAEEVSQRFDWALSRAVKYAEIVPALMGLGRHVALLAGDISAGKTKFPEIEWREPIRLPWGDRRYLLMGIVSRGTRST